MIRFVPASAVLLMHSELIREFGGKPGIRDRGLLESALGRPKNLHAYKKSDLFRLAASYSYGVIKNHPFFDGNKRVGLALAYTFLQINRMELTASEEEATIVMLGVADGSVDEKTLTKWLQANSKTITGRSRV